MTETVARNSRKVRTGVVVSISGTKKLHAHDEECTAGVGDTVRVMECRPLSKMKRWRLVEIIERAK